MSSDTEWKEVTTESGNKRRPGFFEILPGMESIPCALCEEPDCDMIIQDMVPGGQAIVLHEQCFEDYQERRRHKLEKERQINEA